MAQFALDKVLNLTIQQAFRGLSMEETLALANRDFPQLNNQNKSERLFALNNFSDPTDEAFKLASSQQLATGDVEMQQFERVFWIFIFTFMIGISFGGNLIVVYVVATNKEMKSVTNYFLVNLSLADTMVSTLNVIFNFISMLNSHWPFGLIYCKISNFIAILSISASVFTLTAISCDRYNAIIHPLRPRMSHTHAILWILLIWTLSSALSMPNAIYSTLVEDRFATENPAVACALIWPDGRYPTSSYDHIYNIIILVVTYFFPILTMAILYYRVGKELWGYEAIGENIDKQQRAIMAKKKIVKMMIVVVIIFALCWLPYQAFFVVNYYIPTLFQDMPLFYQRCYLFMYWLAMSNSMYNPIIIYFMNSKFRHEFRKILYLLCCCRTYVPHAKKASNLANKVTAATAVGNNCANNKSAPTNSIGKIDCKINSHSIGSDAQDFNSNNDFQSTIDNRNSSCDDNSSLPVVITMSRPSAKQLLDAGCRDKFSKLLSISDQEGQADAHVNKLDSLPSQQQQKHLLANQMKGSQDKLARQKQPTRIEEEEEEGEGEPFLAGTSKGAAEGNLKQLAAAATTTSTRVNGITATATTGGVHLRATSSQEKLIDFQSFTNEQRQQLQKQSFDNNLDKLNKDKVWI